MTFELYVMRATAIVAAVTFVVTAIFALARSKRAVSWHAYAGMLLVTGAVVLGAQLGGRIGWLFLTPWLIATPPAYQLVKAKRKGAAVATVIVAAIVSLLGGAIAIGNVM